MRYQDLEAAEDLLEQAADAESGHLTLARVGEDRRESQVASQPLSSFAELREWFHGAVRRTKPGEDGAKLRLRLWNETNRPVRGVTFKAWKDREPTADTEGAPASDAELALPVVRSDAAGPPVQSTAVGLVGAPSAAANPTPAVCPGCSVLQASLLASRVEAAQLIQQLRHAEDRMWRMEQAVQQQQETNERVIQLEERNQELAEELRRYKRALAQANRDNERKSEYLRQAKVVADYVNQLG